MKENRLIGVTLSDFGLTDAQKVTQRNAESIVQQQNAGYGSGFSQNGMNPNADIVQRLVQTNFGGTINPVTPLEQKRQDAGMLLADASLYQKDPGKTPVADIYKTAPATTTGSMAGGNIEQLRNLRQSGQEGGIDANGNVVNQGQGVLAGNPNVAGSGGGQAGVATQAQIAQNQQNLSGIANVGFGVSPSQRSEAAKLEAQAAELAAVSRTTQRQTGTDKNGLPIMQTITDPNYEKNLSDIKNRQAQQNLTDVTAAKLKSEQEAKNATPPSASIDSFLAGIPEDQRQNAQAIMQPLYDYFEAQKANINAGLKSEQDSIAQNDATAKEYFNKQGAQNESLFKYFNEENKASLDRQNQIAENIQATSLRNEERARDRSEVLYDRAIRDQIAKNEGDKKDQLLGLGISGGWRASRQTADVISALAKGDQTLADLYGDAAFKSRESADKLLEVEDKYHNSVLENYDKYRNTHATLYKEFNERATELDKTIFDTTKEKNDAVRTMNKDYLKSYGDAAETFAKELTGNRKYVLDTAKDIRKEQYDHGKDTFNQAMTYIEKVGTKNKALLSYYETELGYAPGSLSNYQTIEELKMNKGLDGGGVDLGTISTFAQARMSAFDSIYGDSLSPEDKAKKVMDAWVATKGTGDKARPSVTKMADYLTTYYGQGEEPVTGASGPSTKKFYIDPIDVYHKEPASGITVNADGSVTIGK